MGRHVSLLVVNVTWIDLDPLAFTLFLSQFWIASKLGVLCDAMAGSLSVASTAVSSAKFAVADSGEVGRSAVSSRYNNKSKDSSVNTEAERPWNRVSFPEGARSLRHLHSSHPAFCPQDTWRSIEAGM
jgi:hypothetical protein